MPQGNARTVREMRFSSREIQAYHTPVKLQKDHEARVAGSRKGICRACQHRPSPIWKVSQPTFTPHSLLLTRALECPESVRGVMDQPLRCNNQIGGYCRNQLTDEAVVTTCSYVPVSRLSQRHRLRSQTHLLPRLCNQNALHQCTAPRASVSCLPDESAEPG